MLDPAYFRNGSPTVADVLVSSSLDRVEVWKVNLRFPRWQYCLDDLPTDECDRAGRFAFERDRRRWVVARSALRRLIGVHVHAPPRRVRLRVRPHGKPCLLVDGDSAIVHFNVSHSEDLALIALSREREVGVDVERVRWLIDLDGIAAREFAPAERRALLRATPTERLALFYRYWTLKEAHVKAEGVGLRAPLDTVDVSAVTESPVVVRSGWTARTLMCEPGYAAALVVAGCGRYSLASRDFFFGDPQWSAPLTTTDTPPTVETSCSANG